MGELAVVGCVLVKSLYYNNRTIELKYTQEFDEE